MDVDAGAVGSPILEVGAATSCRTASGAHALAKLVHQVSASSARSSIRLGSPGNTHIHFARQEAASDRSVVETLLGGQGTITRGMVKNMAGDAVSSCQRVYLKKRACRIRTGRTGAPTASKCELGGATIRFAENVGARLPPASRTTTFRSGMAPPPAGRSFPCVTPPRMRTEARGANVACRHSCATPSLTAAFLLCGRQRQREARHLPLCVRSGSPGAPLAFVHSSQNGPSTQGAGYRDLVLVDGLADRRRRGLEGDLLDCLRDACSDDSSQPAPRRQSLAKRLICSRSHSRWRYGPDTVRVLKLPSG